MKIEVACGTTVAPSTQEEIDYVEANFRAGDRLEHESLGGGRTLLSEFETCWTVRLGGEIIGYCGVAVPCGMTAFADGRWLCYMSCENADRHKIAYVRNSRAVMRLIVGMTPGHVTTFKSLPNRDYRGSVMWHERVLKMRRAAELEIKGHPFILFETTRKEVLG